jgi:hypothetical protein
MTEISRFKPRVGGLICRPKNATPFAGALLLDVSFVAPPVPRPATDSVAFYTSEWALPKPPATDDDIVILIEYDWGAPAPSKLLEALGPLVQLDVGGDPLHADVAALAGSAGQCTWPLSHLVRVLMAAAEANRVCTMLDAEPMNRPRPVAPPPPSAIAAFLLPLRQVRRVPTAIDIAGALHRVGIVPTADPLPVGRLSVCLNVRRLATAPVPGPWGCEARDWGLSAAVDEALTAGRAAATRARILRALALQAPDEATACAMQLTNGTLRSAMP